MGVRGLSLFFHQNPDLSKQYKLYDSHVIFDGNNLIHALYFNFKVNFMFGGDYKKYADDIRRYLSIFLECGLKPIIVFDGGYEKSDRKLKTVIERSKNRLTQVQYIAKYGCCTGKVLPIMAYEVFYSVLIDLQIPFAQCDYEADDQVTTLANYYNCPVISGDSDFYIFDIHNGFIHLDSVDITINLEIDSSGKEYKFLNCKIYYIDQFVSFFPGLDKNILPLFGTLLGNDFVKANEFDNFFSNIQLPKYKGKKLILNSRHKKMLGLLCWLQNNTLNEAVDQVMMYLKKDKRKYVKSIIESSVNGYKLNHCSLSFVIDNKLKDFETELLLESRLTTPCGNSLPIDFVIKFHQGHFPSFFINVITLHRVFLQPQVENITFPSSYSCSYYIRQLLYGILIRHVTNGVKCKSQSCLSSIEEYDRQRSSLQKGLVAPIFSLGDLGILPNINQVSYLKSEKHNKIIFHVLGVSSDFVKKFPAEWQLFIGCIMYWLCNCIPHTLEASIYALFLNFMYFSFIKQNKVNTVMCSNKTSEVTKCTCSSIPCMLSNINEANLLYARENLKKYTKKPPFNQGNPLITDIVHGYSQLQACILYTIYLNKLLGGFLKNPTPETCFSGTMLYNLTRDIFTRSNPELFIGEILGRDTNLHVLFKEIISNIYEKVPGNLILKDYSPHQKKKSKKNKNMMYCDVKHSQSSNKFSILSISDLELL